MFVCSVLNLSFLTLLHCFCCLSCDCIRYINLLYNKLQSNSTLPPSFFPLEYKVYYSFFRCLLRDLENADIKAVECATFLFLAAMNIINVRIADPIVQ